MEVSYNFPKMMKRKELDGVNDDFSEFSLSSPARKIRRLDSELPPIIEEEEPEIPVELDQPELETSFGSSSSRRGVIIEELPNVPVNEDRAIVVFKPFNAQLTQSLSNVSITVDPQFISGLKNELLCLKGTDVWRSIKNERREQEEYDETDNCRAVVPWIPPQFPSVTGGEKAFTQTDSTDMMEAEEMEGVTMDIEDGSFGMDQTIGLNTNEGLHQWQQQQQQHCMIPQPPQNISSPLVWYP